MPNDNDNDDDETENTIVVTADRLAEVGEFGASFGGGFSGGFGFFAGDPAFFGGGGGAASTPSEKESAEEENEIIVTAPRPSKESGDDTPLTVGDFTAAVFDFLDGRITGEDAFEFKAIPPNIEYDLSISEDRESATFTVYDRMNETTTTYTFNNSGGYGQFDMPIDNSDFTRGGQNSVPEPRIDYDFL